MCEICVELDDKIAHYQRLAYRVTDERTHDGIEKLIAEMKAQKAALHPEQEQ
jgi:hypothetical protein